MNIIEAIRSGKKYRRIGEKNWYESINDYLHYNFPIRAIIANDWEIEEISCYAGSAMITREQFNEAWDNALVGTRLDRDALAKELGL